MKPYLYPTQFPRLKAIPSPLVSSAMEKSGYIARNNSDESNLSNPFRNPGALGAPPPPPYEQCADSSSGQNSRGAVSSYNQDNQNYSAPEDKQSGQRVRGGNYEANNNYRPVQPSKFTPPPGPPSHSNPYGGGYDNNSYPQGPNGYQGGSNSRNLGPSRDYQESYNQGPQQHQGHWYNNNPQYQSSPGSADASSSRGFFPPQRQQQQQQQQYQPSSDRSGGGGGLLGKLGGRNPLDPPPLQFSRPAPGNYPYNMFPPMVCLGMSANLADGWPIVPPPAPQGMEHPFMSHDIMEQDWTQ